MLLFDIALTILAIMLLVASGFIFYRRSAKSFPFLVIILLIFLVQVLQTLFKIDPRTVTLIGTILSTHLLGPLLYMHFLNIFKGLTKYSFIHLFLPISIVILNLYNIYLSGEEKIEISILGNGLGDIINIIYALVSLRFARKLQNSHVGKSNWVNTFFFLIIILFIVSDSLISMSSVLYFTDDVDLVNLSVELPKEYYSGLFFLFVALASLIGSKYTMDLIKLR